MTMDPGGTDVEPVDSWPITKPGFRSSEWWLAVGTSVVTAAVAIAALFGRHLNGDSLTPIVAAVAALGPVIASAFYSIARGRVKAAAHAAAGARMLSVGRLSSVMAEPINISSTGAGSANDVPLTAP